MQALELGRGIGAELVGQHLARALERRQRLGLAARAVEREHQVRPHPLAERVASGERLELGHDRGVTAHRDLGRDPMLGRRQPQLLEPRGLAPEGGLLRDVGERVRPPQRERVGQGRGGGRRDRTRPGPSPASRAPRTARRRSPRGRRRARSRRRGPRSVRRRAPCGAGRRRSAGCCGRSRAAPRPRARRSAGPPGRRGSRAGSGARGRPAASGPPRASLRPSSETSSGPRIRNSIAANRTTASSGERKPRRGPVTRVTFQRTATGLRPGCEGTGRGCRHGHRNPHPQPPDRHLPLPARRRLDPRRASGPPPPASPW